jgi:nuclear cap-binding protein subunit 1
MLDPTHQLLDTIISSLRILDASDFAETFTTFPQPYADYPELDTSVSVPFHLPAVLVPPEIVELDGISAEASEEPKARLGEWPIYRIRLFDNDVRLFILHFLCPIS